MHYCLLTFVLAPITCGIALFVWFHNLSNRIGKELTRRGIGYGFSASTFWLWYVLGSNSLDVLDNMQTMCQLKKPCILGLFVTCVSLPRFKYGSPNIGTRWKSIKPQAFFILSKIDA